MELKETCAKASELGEVLSNPFNGIESRGAGAEAHPRGHPQNPFNGIERGIASASCLGVCVLGIHSMELKEFAR